MIICWQTTVGHLKERLAENESVEAENLSGGLLQKKEQDIAEKG